MLLFVRSLVASLVVLLLIPVSAIGVAATPPPANDTNEKQPATARDAKARPRRPSARERAAARRAAKEAARLEKQAADRKQWLARLAVREVEAWPELEPDKVHADALAESRAMIDEVIAAYPGAQLYETERFLFVSNMPPQQVGPYVAYLDRMYDWMCRLYGVPQGHKVWLGGKAPIFAFVERNQFEAFEEKYFPEARQALLSVENIYGLCHLSPTGEVVISCWRGNDPADFGQMLIHETSHGFIHRHKTKAQLPNWVDEGMADLIGAEMVPASKAVRTREIKAVQALAQQRSLGGMLAAKRIEGWQYGVASNLNRFLLQASRESYVRFIEGLKEGMKWEEALYAAYGSTPAQMLAHYGQWIGVPELRP